MGIVVGIDIGGSSTKIVGFKDGAIEFVPKLIKANDPVASLFGAFGKFVSENKLSLSDIDKVMVTGVGACVVRDPIYGLSTASVDEFISVGLGGLHLSGLNKAVVVSMGTGTAYVSASADGPIYHIGGTGVGGGTLSALSGRLVGTTQTEILVELANAGDLSKIDLKIGDITTQEMSLPKHATASNFGALSDLATNSDIAIGLLNLVFQTIGVISVFACRNVNCNDVILTGKLSTIKHVPELFMLLTELYGVNYIVPPNSEYATSAGAALAYLNGMKYESIV